MTHTAYQKHFRLVQYATGYHPGPVAPPRTDGASRLELSQLGITLDGQVTFSVLLLRPSWIETKSRPIQLQFL